MASQIAESLRAARESAGVSLSALARRTHYSRALLGHLETGVRPVRPEHVVAYSRALDVAVELLYGPRLDPLRIAHEWLVADGPAQVHRRSGRRVGIPSRRPWRTGSSPCATWTTSWAARTSSPPSTGS